MARFLREPLSRRQDGPSCLHGCSGSWGASQRLKQGHGMGSAFTSQVCAEVRGEKRSPSISTDLFCWWSDNKETQVSICGRATCEG